MTDGLLLKEKNSFSVSCISHIGKPEYRLYIKVGRSNHDIALWFVDSFFDFADLARETFIDGLSKQLILLRN